MNRSCKSAMEKPESGFTLIEIAMVLFIVVLLLGGLVPTITVQLEQQRTRETLKRMDEIQQALLGFAMVNGRLPCPAQPTLATGVANAGVEAMNGNYCACNGATTEAKSGGAACSSSSAANVYGVIPWVTLGLRETDAWDHRFTYRIIENFADKYGANTYAGCVPSPTPAVASFALCSLGALYVKASFGGTAVANQVPAVFLSHGKNGFGAYTIQGAKLATGSTDEGENSNDNDTFVSHPATTSFDDLVAWIAPNILFNRMVTAGKLP